MPSLPNEYVAAADIRASAEAVWKILTDSSAYAAWNPEITRIDGDMAPNARVTAHVRLGSGAVRRVGLRVTQFDPPLLMVWQGGLPLGLFVGTRTFTLTPGDGLVRFTMHLRMTGPLSPLILKSVGIRQPEVDSFSAALRRAAETQDATP